MKQLGLALIGAIMGVALVSYYELSTGSFVTEEETASSQSKPKSKSGKPRVRVGRRSAGSKLRTGTRKRSPTQSGTKTKTPPTVKSPRKADKPVVKETPPKVDTPPAVKAPRNRKKSPVTKRAPKDRTPPAVESPTGDAPGESDDHPLTRRPVVPETPPAVDSPPPAETPTVAKPQSTAAAHPKPKDDPAPTNEQQPAKKTRPVVTIYPRPKPEPGSPTGATAARQSEPVRARPTAPNPRAPTGPPAADRPDVVPPADRPPRAPEAVAIAADTVQVRVNGILVGGQVSAAGVVSEAELDKQAKHDRYVVYFDLSVTNVVQRGVTRVSYEDFRLEDRKGLIYVPLPPKGALGAAVAPQQTVRGGVAFAVYNDSAPERLLIRTGPETFSALPATVFSRGPK